MRMHALRFDYFGLVSVPSIRRRKSGSDNELFSHAENSDRHSAADRSVSVGESEKEDGKKVNEKVL